VTWLIEHSTSHQLLWWLDSLVLRNPLLSQAPKRQQKTLPTQNNNLYISLLLLMNTKKIQLTLIALLVSLSGYSSNKFLGSEDFRKQKVMVRLHSMEGYEGHESFANLAIQKLEQVLNSEKFKQKVLSTKFTKTKGLSNQEIYDVIMKAREEQGEGGSDYIVDLRIRTITLDKDGEKWMRNCDPNSWAKTIGIDGKGDGVMAICPQRLNRWSEMNDYGSLAGHYAHEYMHILGFSHNGLYKRKSLVYKIGGLVEEIINEAN
jgi:hypothetical protein